MKGKEIIELIQNNNLEEIEIGFLRSNDFGDLYQKETKGIVKINEYYHVCCFVDKENYEIFKKDVLSTKKL